MNDGNMTQRLGLGAAAGLAGSVFIQGLLAASQKWAPQALPPIKQDPGDFMVEKAEELLPEGLRRKFLSVLRKLRPNLSRSVTGLRSAHYTAHLVRG